MPRPFRIQQTGADVALILDDVARELTPSLAQKVLEAAQHAEAEIKKEVFNTYASGKGGLARSFESTFLGNDGRVVTASAHSELIYARLQDEGGTIRPRTRKNLAVPIDDSIPPGKYPRHWEQDELTLIKRRGRAPLLAVVTRVAGGEDRVDPKYVLKKSVKIPGTGYIERAADNAQEGITDILQEAVEAATETGT